MDPAAQIKQMLEDAVRRKNAAKDAADFKDISSQLVKEIAGSISPDDVSSAVVDNLSKSIQPVLQQLLEKDRATSADIVAAIQAIEMKVPDITMPEMKAPIVNIPAPIVHVPAPIINIPETRFPEPIPFPEEFSIRGLNPKNPLPVQFVDKAGKPYYPMGGTGGATGGKGDFFTILGIQNTILAVNSDPAGVAYSSSNPFPVTITSGASATSASAIVDSSGQQYSGSNPIPVTITSGGTATSASAIVDSSGVAYSGSNPVPVTFAAAGFQNVAMYDSQQSTITSHQDPTGDFRGLDTTVLRTVNVQSALNSSTTTLTSGSTFTGLAEDVKDFATIQVAVFADQVSGTDGLSIQQSSDGTNWDITDVYTVPASSGKSYSVQVAARYFRIVYTNGATGQAAFRLQSILHQTTPKPSSQRPSDGLSNENDFEQVSAYLAALNASGTWDRLHTGGFDSLGALRVSVATDSVVSVSVTGATGTLATALVDSSGAQYSGTNPLPAVVSTVTSITSTVAAALVDSSGVQYSGSNPLIVDSNDALGQGDTASAMRIVHAGDSAASVASQAVGTNETNVGVLRTILMSDTVYSMNMVTINGNAPATGLNETTAGVLRTVSMSDTATSSQTKLRAMTTLPTAVADAADTFQRSDKLGREINRPVNARDLIATAYVALANGTEATLLTGTAGQLIDLISLIAANTSTAAVQLDIRAGTGGNIVQSLYIPANATTGWTPPVPWPQDATGNTWTVDMPDITNSNVLISALFSREL